MFEIITSKDATRVSSISRKLYLYFITPSPHQASAA